jgi:hypothetical protein
MIRPSMTFPSGHRSRIYSTNPLERLNRELKRRTHVLGIFPDADAVLRQPYLTKGKCNGASADGTNGNGAGVCASGYHFASLWEIVDPSNLAYNAALSFAWTDQTPPLVSDTGQGPPAARQGWVRTGFWSASSTIPGEIRRRRWLPRRDGWLQPRLDLHAGQCQQPAPHTLEPVARRRGPRRGAQPHAELERWRPRRQHGLLHRGGPRARRRRPHLLMLGHDAYLLGHWPSEAGHDLRVGGAGRRRLSSRCGLGAVLASHHHPLGVSAPRDPGPLTSRNRTAFCPFGRLASCCRGRPISATWAGTWQRLKGQAPPHPGWVRWWHAAIARSSLA